MTAPFEKDVAALNTSYLGGLDRKIAEEKAAGHLDGVLALEAEKKLIPLVGRLGETAVVGRETAVVGRETAVVGRETAVVGRETAVVGRETAVVGRLGETAGGDSQSRPPDAGSQTRPTMPIPSAEDDATSVTTPAALKNLRAIYHDAYAKIEATRAANRKALTAPLTTRLKTLESDLTKKDRITDARTVKAFREALGNTGFPPATAPGETPGTHTAGTAVLQSATKDKPFTNSLGMKFVPVPGTDVLFCIHETVKGNHS